jgi:hypothetical protein
MSHDLPDFIKKSTHATRARWFHPRLNENGGVVPQRRSFMYQVWVEEWVRDVVHIWAGHGHKNRRDAVLKLFNRMSPPLRLECLMACMREPEKLYELAKKITTT